MVAMGVAAAGCCVHSGPLAVSAAHPDTAGAANSTNARMDNDPARDPARFAEWGAGAAGRVIGCTFEP
jgi:hypothetical protein